MTFEMNGFEATELHSQDDALKIPIIALTADVTTVDLKKCEAVGMNDYISKPVEERSLYSKMVGFVNNSAPLKPFPAKQNVIITKEGFRKSQHMKGQNT